MRDLSPNFFMIKNATGSPLQPWLLSCICQQWTLLRSHAHQDYRPGSLQSEHCFSLHCALTEGQDSLLNSHLVTIGRGNKLVTQNFQIIIICAIKLRIIFRKHYCFEMSLIYYQFSRCFYKFTIRLDMIK